MGHKSEFSTFKNCTTDISIIMNCVSIKPANMVILTAKLNTVKLYKPNRSSIQYVYLQYIFVIIPDQVLAANLTSTLIQTNKEVVVPLLWLESVELLVVDF